MLKINIIKNIFICSIFFFITSCSNVSQKHTSAWDPIEPVNRAVFSFNMFFDTYALEPSTKVYRYIMPDFIENALARHFNWLKKPGGALNSSLQGKFEEAFNLVINFSINSLALGFINITGENQDIPSSDFDQTLTSYGINPGPYLVLPFAGPTTLRGVGGTLLDGTLDPLNLAGTSNVAKVKATELPIKALNTRAKYFDEINELKYNSIDAYSVFKSVYFQRMRAIENNVDNSSKDSYISDGAIDAFFIQNE